MGMTSKPGRAPVAPHYFAGPSFAARNSHTAGGGTPRPAPLWIRKTLVKGRWVPERTAEREPDAS